MNSEHRQSAFERYVRFIVRHRVGVVVIVLLITAALATQLRHLHLEIRRRAQLPQNHPYVQIDNRIIDVFGGEKIVIIGLVTNKGNIFNPSTLGKVYRITQALLETPGVIETNLFSLAAPHVKAVIAGTDHMMDIRPLMTDPPVSQEAADDVRRLVHADKLFGDNLVSADETATVIVAEFDDRFTDTAVQDRVEEIARFERGDDVRIAIAGAPILRAALTRYTAQIAILFPIAVLIVGLVHLEAFRTLQAAVLPLVTALLSVVWALGAIGITRQPMDTWSAITPVVILAVAAGHSVQILKRYYEEYAECGDNEIAVIRSVAAVGPVLLTAGSIAAAGFLSLVTFGVPSVRAFGLMLSGGILSALAIEMTFTPACRALLPAPDPQELYSEHRIRWLDHALERVADVVVSRPWCVLAISAVVVLTAVVGASRVRVDNSFRLWFGASTQIRDDDALLNDKLPGSSSLRVLVEGEEENVLTEPSVLEAIDDLQQFMGDDSRIGGVVSIVNHVKRIHQAMNDGNPEFYRIPTSRRLIHEYLVLYGLAAGPEDLSALIDGSRRTAVIRALSKNDSAEFSRHVLDRLQEYASHRFKGLPVTVGIAGGTLGVQTAMNDAIVRDKVLNVVQVSGVIFLLASLVFRSAAGGAFVLTPLLFSVVVSLGLLGWSRTWLDMTTAAFTAMGVSIGADFAIYFTFRVREEIHKSRNLEDAVRVALLTSGKAIFFVSSAVALGYLVLPLSGFSVWSRLGLMTAATIGTSAIASLTILPALLIIAKPGFLTKSTTSDRTEMVGSSPGVLLLPHQENETGDPGSDLSVNNKVPAGLSRGDERLGDRH